MTTGQNIKAARKKAGLTQKELAQKLGLSFQSIAQWENDLRNPKLDTIKRIADALCVDWYDLIVPSSKDEERKLKYIKSISNKEDDSLAGAEQMYNDILVQEKQLDIIKTYMSFLNESGKNAAEQLILSIVSKVAVKLGYAENEGLYHLMNRCFYDSVEYEEVAEGVKELAQITAYQRPAEPAGDAPGGTDDKNHAEK